MNCKESILELYRISKTLIVAPKKFWKKEVNSVTLKDVNKYFAWYVIFIALSAFVGEWIAGSKYGVDYWFLFFKALRDALQYVVAIFIGCWAIKEVLAIESDKRNVIKLVVLSSFPAFITTIITNLLPGAYPLEIFSLYTFYLLYIGAPYFFKGAKEHHLRFAGVSIFIMVSSVVVSYYILWNLLKLFYTAA